ASFGFDFNPAVDRIRVTSDQDQDLRLNPNNGTVAAIDSTLAYTSTDRNAGQNPFVIASAYTNNFPGPASTTLYNIDSNLDILVTQNPPNSGTLNTIGSLGVDAGNTGAFDIVGANTAFAALNINGGEANSTGLYTINLSSGAATMVGAIGGGEAIRGLAASLSAAPATVTPAPSATGSVTVTVTVTAQATGTSQATAQASVTSQATATSEATAQPTSPPVATATTAPPAPTQVIEPTATQQVVQPTQQPPGMPRTGQMDITLYIALSLVALSLLGLGWIAHRRTARDMR
ncbi:MAG: DUF4394 domain-containing protein, partial [Chloroflexia bacterium]